MRWLSIPRGFSSIDLYSSGSKLQLPITSVVEEYKVSKAMQIIMLWDSSDQMVQAGIAIQTRSKCAVKKSLAEAKAEVRLHHADFE